MYAKTFGTPRILVGVDTSKNAAHAADWAAELAEELGADLVIAHGLDLPESPAPQHASERRRGAGEALLAQTSARLSALHAGLRIATELVESDPAQALNDLAADADMLVAGTRGHGGFTGMMLGSVSNRLAAHAPRPVFVIGTRTPAATRAELVLGVESKQDHEPIDFAFALAARLGLSLRAVRAFEPWLTYGGSYEPPSVVRDVEDLLEPARHNHPDVPVTIESWRAVAVPALVEAGSGARMIVVGSHRRHGPLAFGPGHVVHGLLSHAETPVAVVPIP